MNWRDIPHLFVNGKFKFLLDNVEYTLHGFINGDFLDLISVKGKDYQTVHTNDCTLIARPISDMSDEEKEIYEELKEPFIFSNTEESFLYLLSIGVYPFDQDNPKDVIWRYENEL